MLLQSFQIAVGSQPHIFWWQIFPHNLHRVFHADYASFSVLIVPASSAHRLLNLGPWLNLLLVHHGLRAAIGRPFCLGGD